MSITTYYNSCQLSNKQWFSLFYKLTSDGEQSESCYFLNQISVRREELPPEVTATLIAELEATASIIEGPSN